MTIVLGAPGWGKSTWLAQCGEHRARQPEHGAAVWIGSRAELDQLDRRVRDRDDRPGVVLVDGLEIDLAADEALWRLLDTVAGSGTPVVVAAIDPPGVHLASDTSVVDERDLAFDASELALIVTMMLESSPNVDVFTIPASMRGCPTLVGRYVRAVLASGKRGVRGTPAIAPEGHLYRTTRERQGLERTVLGRTVAALEGFRTFTPATIEALVPDGDARRMFDRLEMWPVFDVGVDDESDLDALTWTPAIWSLVSSSAGHRAALEAALALGERQGAVVARLVALVQLGRLDEADELAWPEFRWLLMFASPDLVDLVIGLAPDPGRWPVLALLAVVMESRRVGNAPSLRPRALAAAEALRARRPTALGDEMARSGLAVYAYVSAGERTKAARLLAHMLELCPGAPELAAHSSLRARPRVVGNLYLAYWAAIQLDRHEDALMLASLMVEVEDPADRLGPLEAVCLATQRDLAGLTSLAGASDIAFSADPPSHAAALRHLEEGDDAGALGFIRAWIAKPGPVASRSALDGLTLLVRAVAEPDGLPVAGIGAVVARSKGLWQDSVSTFVAFAAVLGYARHQARDEAARLMALRPPVDDFSRLAHIVWAQWGSDHKAAIEMAELAADQATMPRVVVAAQVLEAASLQARGRTVEAMAVLEDSLRSSGAPRLLRFALRFVPDDIAAAFHAQSADCSSELCAVLQDAAADFRAVRWSAPPPLTRRELEVLRLLRRGLTNAEIAAERHVVVGTLRNQLKSLYRKLDVSDREAAVQVARTLQIDATNSSPTGE